MTMAVAAVEKLTGWGKGQFADPSRIDMAGAGEVPIRWNGFPISLGAQGFSAARGYDLTKMPWVVGLIDAVA